MKGLKRIAILLVVLLLGTYIAIPILVQTSWAKEQIRDGIAEATGRDVKIGEITFGWFSGLRVSDVVVHQKEGDHADDGPLFSLGALNLKVGLGDIFRKKINIESFDIDAPRIVIVREPGGEFNISDPVRQLNYLFTGAEISPCFIVGGADPADPNSLTLTEAGRAALDFNGDGRSNLTDAVSALNFRFRGGGAPAPVLGVDCVDVPGTCDSTCR